MSLFPCQCLTISGQRKHCFAELPRPTNTGPSSVPDKLQEYCARHVVWQETGITLARWSSSVISLLCLELRVFFKDAAICIGASRPGFVWNRGSVPCLAFLLFALRAPRALNLNGSCAPLTHPLTHVFARVVIAGSLQPLTKFCGFAAGALSANFWSWNSSRVLPVTLSQAWL